MRGEGAGEEVGGITGATEEGGGMIAGGAGGVELVGEGMGEGAGERSGDGGGSVRVGVDGFDEGMGTLAILKNSSMSSVGRLQSSRNLFMSFAYR